MEQNKPMPWPFDENEIHFVEAADGTRLIPLVDLADAIGYTRRGLHQIAGMTRETLEGDLVNLSTGNQSQVGDKQGDLALIEHGVDLLLLKVPADRIKDPENRDKLIRYQRWLVKTLAANVDVGEVFRMFR